MKSLYKSTCLLLFFLGQFLFPNIIGKAQSNFECIYKVPFNAKEVSCDKFGNLYAVSGSSLVEYDSTFKLLKTYSSKPSSVIHSVDVSNAFKILVFLKEFSILQMLDNTFSPTISDIQLSNLHIDQPEMMCSASENSFWVFDQSSFQLYRFNYFLQQMNSSGDIRSIIAENSFPVKMMEFDSKLYVLFSGTGILVFDAFGAYIKTIPFEKAIDFQVSSNYIFFLKDKKFSAFQRTTLEQIEYPLPESPIKKFCLYQNRLYLLGSDSLWAYILK